MIHAWLFREGRRVRDDVRPSELADLLTEPQNLLWFDLATSQAEELKDLAARLHLHPLAVEDALEDHQRAKLDRYETHLFLTAYLVNVSTDARPGDPEETFTRHEIDVFVLPKVLITVHEDVSIDLTGVTDQWAAHPRLVSCGVGGLLWGLLDVIVDSHFDAVQQLDELIDDLEEAVFAEDSNTTTVQRAAYRVHKDLVLFRRLVLPMREAISGLMRRDEVVADSGHSDELQPYFLDVYDHALRVADWTDSLRDLVSTVLDTNLTAQGNRMNLVMKKVTSWAAIIAVPTLVTGYFGMNLPFPLNGTHAGFWTAIVVMAVASTALYVQFKWRDWL